MRCSILVKKSIAVIVAVVCMAAQVQPVYASSLHCTVNAQCLAAYQIDAGQPVLSYISNTTIKYKLAGITRALEKIRPYVKGLKRKARKRSFQTTPVKTQHSAVSGRNRSFYGHPLVLVGVFFFAKLFLSLLGFAPSFSEAFSQQTGITTEDTGIVIPGFQYTLSDTVHFTNDTTYDDPYFQKKYNYGLFNYSSQVYIFAFDTDWNYLDYFVGPESFDGKKMKVHTVRDTSYIEVYNSENPDDPGNLWYRIFPQNGSLQKTSKPSEPEAPPTIDTFHYPVVDTIHYGDYIFGLYVGSTPSTGIQLFTFDADGNYLYDSTAYANNYEGDSMRLRTVEDTAYIEVYKHDNPEYPRRWYRIDADGHLTVALNPEETDKPLTLDNFHHPIVDTIHYGNYIFGLYVGSTPSTGIQLFTFDADGNYLYDSTAYANNYEGDSMRLRTVEDTAYIEVYKHDNPEYPRRWYRINAEGTLAVASDPEEPVGPDPLTLENFPYTLVDTVNFNNYIFGLHFDSFAEKIQIFTFDKDGTYLDISTNFVSYKADRMQLHVDGDVAYLRLYLNEKPEETRVWYLINPDGSVQKNAGPSEPEGPPTLGNFPHIILDTVYFEEGGILKYIFGLEFRYTPIPQIRIFTFDANGYCIDSTDYVTHISNSMQLVTVGDSAYLETYLGSNPDYPRERFLINKEDGSVTLVGGASPTGIEDVSFGVATESVKVFPNPMRSGDVANISYDVVEAGTVTIVVYDQSGRPVQTIVNEMQYPGEHTAQWHANGMSSGVYFVRISIDNKPVTTKKVVKAGSTAFMLLSLLFGLTGKGWKSLFEAGIGDAVNGSKGKRSLRIYLDRQTLSSAQPQQEVPVSYAQLEESGLVAPHDLTLFAEVAHELGKEDDVLSDEVLKLYFERKVAQTFDVIFFDSAVDNDVAGVQKGIQASSFLNEAVVVTTEGIFAPQEGVFIMNQESDIFGFEFQPEHGAEKRVYFRSTAFNGNIGGETLMFRSA